MSSTDKTLDFIPQAEVNLSTLPLTSFQDRIPVTFTSWTTYITIGNLSRKLECHSNQEVGDVPHGIDADFLIALQQVTLNHMQNGGDADTIVFVSPRELLRLAGQDDSGRHYALVDESLRRLRHTVYTASEGWYEGERKGHTSQTFNILDELTVSSVGRKGQENRTLIGLRLHRVIRDSIARGLLRHLDIAFYYSLSRPQARALYRALESKRFHNNTDRDQFTIGILEWGRELKILDQTPSKIRRALEDSHSLLIEYDYLKDVQYVGRGKDQTLTYTYQTVSKVEHDSGPIKQLVQYGLANARAEAMLEKHGKEHILASLVKAKEIIAGGFKPLNRAGFITDVISNPQKYQAGTVEKSVVRQQVPLIEEPDMWDGFERLERKAQVEFIFKSLTVVVNHLSPDHLTSLAQMLVVSPVDLRKYHGDVIKARLTKDQTALKQLLGLDPE